MNDQDFYDRVVASEDLAIMGIRDGKLLVVHRSTKSWFEVEPAAVTDNDWETLEAVLVGKRSAEILNHLTRITGYYSQFKESDPRSIMNAWNRSKLGENKARRRGDYSISGVGDA